MTAGRIRVLIAGNIYVKRALVRRFLEDDGYEVVAEALTRSDILPAIRRGGPDAVVVDDELLEEGTIQRIRRAAPDAKVVVFTSTPLAAPTAMIGADAYLEKGVGLAALTALLGRLFEPDRDALALVGAGVGATAAATSSMTDGTEVEAPMADESISSAPSRTPASGGPAARLIAIAGGAILIVVGLVAMITTGGGGTEPAPADTTDQTAGGIVVAEPVEQTELDDAYAALDRMIVAIEGGNYVLATVEAQALMDARAAAFAAGFTTSGLDAEVTARLEVVVVGIPVGAADNLGSILGALYPTLEEEESTPGGGSDLVLGETVSNDGGSTSGGGTTTDGGGGGGGGGGGDTTVTPQPGDGRVWGQWHKENKGSGGPPPWAKGKAQGQAK